uniref:Uncharacterized protein n=1 Tax=Mesocestoides corti TaxID=53468 RepID=A0A5K3FBG1_MESCO
MCARATCVRGGRWHVRTHARPCVCVGSPGQRVRVWRGVVCVVFFSISRCDCETAPRCVSHPPPSLPPHFHLVLTPVNSGALASPTSASPQVPQLSVPAARETSRCSFFRDAFATAQIDKIDEKTHHASLLPGKSSPLYRSSAGPDFI